MKQVSQVSMVVFMLGCMGPDQETLVDELRVMAIQVEPAEVQLRDFIPDANGETLDPVINVVIGDPLETGYQVAVWPCTNFGEGCEEKRLFEENPSDWIALIEGADTVVTLPVINNPLWGGILSQAPDPETPLPITSIFALACEPGVCLELQNAANGEWDLERFGNPFDWISELPLGGTSLAFKQLPVSNGLSNETRMKNPNLRPTFDVETPLTTTVDTPLVLPFEIELFQQDEDVASIFGYATRGGFGRNVFANNGLRMFVGEPAERAVTWYAGEAETGASTLFVIVEDGAGGTGFWTGTGVVE